MPSVGTRGSGHKIKYKKFHLNIRKYTENWHRVPREAVESASLEIFKNLTGYVLVPAAPAGGGTGGSPDMPPNLSPSTML